jgi:2'-5' RNA ligase
MTEKNEKEKTRRLFFALWPDEAIQKKLHTTVTSLHKKHGARQVPRQNIHMTLQFLGDVPESVMPCLAEAASEVHGQPFSLNINKLIHRERQRMIWAVPSETPEVLRNLATSLGKQLEQCGVQTEKRPYLAHITLVRKLSRLPRPVELSPLQWDVEEFCLVESAPQSTGAVYTVLEKWRLQR